MTIKGLLSRAETTRAKSEQCMHVTTIALASIYAISLLAYGILTHASHVPPLGNMSAHATCLTYAVGGGLVSTYFIGLIAYWCASIRRKKDQEYLQKVAKELPAGEQENALRELKDLHHGFYTDLTHEINKLENKQRENVMKTQKISHSPEFAARQGDKKRELLIIMSASVAIMALSAFAYMMLSYHVQHLPSFLHQSQQATRLIYTIGAGAALSTLVILTTHCYFRVKHHHKERPIAQVIAENMSKAEIHQKGDGILTKGTEYSNILLQIGRDNPKQYIKILDAVKCLNGNKENALRILCLELETYMLYGLDHRLSKEPEFLRALAKNMSDEKLQSIEYTNFLLKLREDYPELYKGLLGEIHSLKENKRNALEIFYMVIKPNMFENFSHPVFQDHALLVTIADDMAKEKGGRDAAFYAELLQILGDQHPKLYVGLIENIASRAAGQEEAMKVLCLALEPYLILGQNISGLSQDFIDTFETVRKNTHIQVDRKSITAEEHFEALQV